eukprot:765504-Hanusia_phi.AAC.8
MIGEVNCPQQNMKLKTTWIAVLFLFCHEYLPTASDMPELKGKWHGNIQPVKSLQLRTSSKEKERRKWRLEIEADGLAPDEMLALTGNVDVLGDWNVKDAKYLKRKKETPNVWFCELELPQGFTVEYKYLIKKAPELEDVEERCIEDISTDCIVRETINHMAPRTVSLCGVRENGTVPSPGFFQFYTVAFGLQDDEYLKIAISNTKVEKLNTVQVLIIVFAFVSIIMGLERKPSLLTFFFPQVVRYGWRQIVIEGFVWELLPYGINLGVLVFALTWLHQSRHVMKLSLGTMRHRHILSKAKQLTSSDCIPQTAICTFELDAGALGLSEDDSVSITGSNDWLGNWQENRAVPLHRTKMNKWAATIPLPVGQEMVYKYLVHHSPRIEDEHIHRKGCIQRKLHWRGIESPQSFNYMNPVRAPIDRKNEISFLRFSNGLLILARLNIVLTNISEVNWVEGRRDNMMIDRHILDHLHCHYVHHEPLQDMDSSFLVPQHPEIPPKSFSVFNVEARGLHEKDVVCLSGGDETLGGWDPSKSIRLQKVKIEETEVSEESCSAVI